MATSVTNQRALYKIVDSRGLRIDKAEVGTNLNLLGTARGVSPADEHGGIGGFVRGMDDYGAITTLLDKRIISFSRIGIPLGLIRDDFVARWLPIGQQGYVGT